MSSGVYVLGSNFPVGECSEGQYLLDFSSSLFIYCTYDSCQISVVSISTSVIALFKFFLKRHK